MLHFLATGSTTCYLTVVRLLVASDRNGAAAHAIVNVREARHLTLVNIMSLENDDEEKSFRHFMHMEKDVEENLRRRREELLIDGQCPRRAYIDANRRSRAVSTPCVFASRPYRLTARPDNGSSASAGA